MRRTAAAIGVAFVALPRVPDRDRELGSPELPGPLEGTVAGAPGAELHGAWVFRQGGEFRLADGQRPDPAVVDACVSDVGLGKRFDEACLAQHDIGVFSHATYHPESRFWLFQAIEAGIFTALTLALLAFAIWWIRKRIS